MLLWRKWANAASPIQAGGEIRNKIPQRRMGFCLPAKDFGSSSLLPMASRTGYFLQSHLFEKPCLVQWNFSQLLILWSACWALWEALFSSLCLPIFQLFVIFFYLYTISWWEGGTTEPEVASDSTRNNWHKLKYKGFPFNIRLYFPLCEPWADCPGKLQILHCWRCAKLGWTRPCPRWPCLEHQAGPDLH